MSNCNPTAASRAAIITPVLAAGSTASPYAWQINLTTRLCRSTCADRPPIFNPAFTLVSFASVGTNMYMATIAVQGVISYVPCGCSECCPASQLISQTFALPFYSATAPTSVTIEAGATINSVAASPCCVCGKTFASETPLTLTVA